MDKCNNSEHELNTGSNLMMTCCNKKTVSSTSCVEMLLYTYENVNKTDNDGCTVLFDASDDDNVCTYCLKSLINTGADVNHKNNTGKTALHYACINFKNKDEDQISVNLEKIKILLDAGADIKLFDNSGQSCFAFACTHSTSLSSIKCVKLLIEYGADINESDSIRATPLLKACSSPCSDLETVDLLLKSGANVNMRTQNGSNILFYVINKFQKYQSADFVDTVKLLIDNGFNVNNADNNLCTALMFIMAVPDCEEVLRVTKMLINAGANVNFKNDLGESCLLICAGVIDKNINKLDTLKLLLESGADVNSQNNDGNTCLIVNSCKLSKNILTLLIDAGYDLNIKNKYGYTILMCIILFCKTDDQIELLNTILKYKPDINIKNSEGDSALILAIKHNVHNSAKIVKILIDAGADVNIQNNKSYNALMYAIEDSLNDTDSEDNLYVVNLLIDAGINLNALFGNKYTALMLIASCDCKNKNLSVIQRLIDAGSDINFVNCDGETALSIAIDNLKNDLHVLNYLINPALDFSYRYPGNHTTLMCILINIREYPHIDFKHLLIKTIILSKNCIYFKNIKGYTAYGIYNFLKYDILDEYELSLLKGEKYISNTKSANKTC